MEMPPPANFFLAREDAPALFNSFGAYKAALNRLTLD
jgi:hypothetical protein